MSAGTAPSCTSFDAFSHEQLIAMVQGGDPGAAQAMTAAWEDLGKALYDRFADLSDGLAALSEHWQGRAADAYQAQMNQLVSTTADSAQAALGVRDAIAPTSGALKQAQADMPPPYHASAMADVAGFAFGGLLGKAAVDSYQNHQADAAKAKAVQVMQKLAGNYATSTAAIPDPPPYQGPKASGRAPDTRFQGPGSTAPGTGPVSATPSSPSAQGAPPARTGGGGPSYHPGPGATTPSQPGHYTPPGQSAPGTHVAPPAPVHSVGQVSVGTTPASVAPVGTTTAPAAGVNGLPTAGGGGAQSPAGGSPLFGGLTGAAVGGGAAALLGGRGSLGRGPGGPGTGGAGLFEEELPGGGRLPGGAVLGEDLPVGRYAGSASPGRAGLPGGGPVADETLPSGQAAAAARGGMLGGQPGAVAGNAAASEQAAMARPPLGGMGGMGGAGSGSARKRKTWLVETDDVWSGNDPVSPSVLGDDDQ